MKRIVPSAISATILIVIIIGFAFTGEGTKFIIKQDVQIYKDISLIKASDKFGLDIFKQEIQGNKNVVISPLSLFTVFNIASSGASGETRKQMKSVMNISNYSEPQLNDGMNDLINFIAGNKENKYNSIADLYNSLWIDTNFEVKNSFIKTSKMYYNSETFKQKLETKKTVDDMNKWVSVKSKGLINKPIDKIDKNTVLAILNVLYFNDKWTQPFDKTNTKVEKFILQNGSAINSKMMNAERNVSYYEDNETKAGIFDYSRGSMMVLLPKGNINDFVAKLNIDKISKYNEEAQTDMAKIKMPILNLNYANNLNKTLNKMGMVLPFDSNNANFDNIKANKAPLWISEVLHNCVVKVDEKGTKAVAFTGAIMTTKTVIATHEIKELYLNKPFIFIIQDKSSKLILFVGKVDNPAPSN